MSKAVRIVVLALALIALPMFGGCRTVVGVGYGWGHDGDGGYRDGGDRDDRDHGDRGDRGGHWGREYAASPEQSAAALAQDYSISPESAQTVITLASSEKTNEQKAAIAKMGVTATQMAPLNRLEMPDQSTIETIANKLGEEPSKIENVLTDYVTDVKAAQQQN